MRIPDVVPAKRSLVDLSKSETAALVGVLDVEEVIVEVVVGSIASRCLGDGRGRGSCLGRHC